MLRFWLGWKKPLWNHGRGREEALESSSNDTISMQMPRRRPTTTQSVNALSASSREEGTQIRSSRGGPLKRSPKSPRSVNCKLKLNGGFLHRSRKDKIWRILGCMCAPFSRIDPLHYCTNGGRVQFLFILSASSILLKRSA